LPGYNPVFILFSASCFGFILLLLVYGGQNRPVNAVFCWLWATQFLSAKKCRPVDGLSFKVDVGQFEVDHFL